MKKKVKNLYTVTEYNGPGGVLSSMYFKQPTKQTKNQNEFEEAVK